MKVTPYTRWQMMGREGVSQLSQQDIQPSLHYRGPFCSEIDFA